MPRAQGAGPKWSTDMSKHRISLRTHFQLFLIAMSSAASAHGGQIGINVLLNRAPDRAVLTNLALHGNVLNVIAEINAVTMKVNESELPNIRALPYVTSATPDVECELAGSERVPIP